MSVIIDGSAGVTTATGAVYNGLQTGTAQASTSGTAITFTGIPSWVKRVTVMFQGVSTTGTSPYLIRIGSGSIASSGYVSAASFSGATMGYTSSTAGFALSQVTASQSFSGILTINLLNASSFIYCESGVIADGSSYSAQSGGSVTLSGLLDRVQVTTVNGTDTFDAGSINIIYE